MNVGALQALPLLGPDRVGRRKHFLVGAGEGCSSLFTYCTQVLHLSEHAAYHRIEAARAARWFPIILDLVADGSVTLTTVAMLRPHLNEDNHEALLGAARHKSKREVELLIAALAPQPDAKALIRRLPTQRQVQADLTEPVDLVDGSTASSSEDMLARSSVSRVALSGVLEKTPLTERNSVRTCPAVARGEGGPSCPAVAPTDHGLVRP